VKQMFVTTNYMPDGKNINELRFSKKPKDY